MENPSIECGISGEYDSMDTLLAKVVIGGGVVSLGIDYIGMLYATTRDIARRKAAKTKKGGILVRGRTAFCCAKRA
jgi:folylpolyglutamate synthase/dihydropteroate synthase